MSKQILDAIRTKSDAEAVSLLSRLLTGAFDRGVKSVTPPDPTETRKPVVPSLPFINFGDEAAARDAVRACEGQGMAAVPGEVLAALLAELSRLRGCPLDPTDPLHPKAPTPGVGLRPGFGVATAMVIARVYPGAPERERVSVAQSLVEGCGFEVVALPKVGASPVVIEHVPEPAAA